MKETDVLLFTGELADLLEVIYAIAESRGETPESLNALAEKKSAERGRFREKYLLLSVEG